MYPRNALQEMLTRHHFLHEVTYQDIGYIWEEVREMRRNMKQVQIFVDEMKRDTIDMIKRESAKTWEKLDTLYPTTNSPVSVYSVYPTTSSQDSVYSMAT